MDAGPETKKLLLKTLKCVIPGLEITHFFILPYSIYRNLQIFRSSP